MGRAPTSKRKSSSKRGRSSSGSRATSSRGRSRSKGKEKAEKKSTRKVKDKKRPKRALGAYMYFCKDQRKDIQDQNPDMSFGDIGRVLGSQWSRLNDREKQENLAKSSDDDQGREETLHKKYVRKSEADKKRYDKEMKKYKPRH